MPTNESINTPRTDEAYRNARMANFGGMTDMTCFARQLETELVQLRKELEVAKERWKFFEIEYKAFDVVLTSGLELLQQITGYTNYGLNDGINRIAKERDKLKQQLEEEKQNGFVQARKFFKDEINQLKQQVEDCQNAAHKVIQHNTKLQNQVEELKKDKERLNKLLANDTPWPLVDTLQKASDALLHLLTTHNCDCHGHELISEARIHLGKSIDSARKANNE